VLNFGADPVAQQDRATYLMNTRLFWSALVLLALLSEPACADDVIDLTGSDVEGVTAPIPIEGASAHPRESQREGERGTVVLVFVVGTDGTVTDAKIVQPTQSQHLNDAAVADVVSRIYKPATRDGKRIAVRVAVVERFSDDSAIGPPTLGASADARLSCRYGTHNVAVEGCSAMISSSTGTALKNALYFRARGYEALGRHAEAIADLNRLIDLVPKQAELFLALGFAYEEIGQFASAIRNYDSALALDPHFTAGYLYRGFTYAESGKPDRAVAEYKSAAANPPRCAAIAEGRGFGDDPYAGRPALVEGMFLSPTIGPFPGVGGTPTMIVTPNTVVNRPCVRPQLMTAEMLQAFPPGSTGEADFYQRRCTARAMDNVDLPLALADCDKAIALNSNFARAHDARGLIRFRQNAYEDSIADLNSALAINPRLASSLYIRGLARARTGDADGARADLLKARSIGPEISADFALYGVAP